jgi:hypothetical protein
MQRCALGEIPAVEELHRVVRNVVVDPVIEHAHNARMIEQRKRLTLELEQHARTISGRGGARDQQLL